MTHYDANDDHQLLPEDHLDPGDIDSNGYCVHGITDCIDCHANQFYDPGDALKELVFSIDDHVVSSHTIKESDPDPLRRVHAWLESIGFNIIEKKESM